ncbi:unnamed protein product [Brassica rapa subsp. narinosa]
MANKLFLVPATLAFFFLLTNASIYRTVVEFDEDNQIGPFGPQQCQKEFEQTQHLRACQQWIHMQATQPPSGPRALEFEVDIENPQGSQLKATLFQQCCNELRQEDKICVCPALKHVSKEVRIQFEQEQHQGLPQIVSRIYQTATQLPKFCKVPQVSVCPFQHDMPFPPYY